MVRAHVGTWSVGASLCHIHNSRTMLHSIIQTLHGTRKYMFPAKTLTHDMGNFTRTRSTCQNKEIWPIK